MTASDKQTYFEGDVERWFGWLVVIGPIHMCEQLSTGLDELQQLKAMMASYYSMFAQNDVATVVLVMIVFMVVQLLLYAMLLGGRWRLFAAGFLGAASLGEIHHVIKTIVNGQYFPGFATALPFAWIGGMLLIAVIREWRQTSVPESLPAAA